jgi:hypothetical protein
MYDGKKGSIRGDEGDRVMSFFKYHIDNNLPVIPHNGICYDIPLVEKLLGVDLSELMVIDTLAAAWYILIGRNRYGLDSFFEDYGIEKLKIDDWEGLSYGEYKNRCEIDVKISKALWEDLKGRLINMYTTSKTLIDSGEVGGKRLSDDEVIYLDRFKGTTSVDEWIDKILTFLMFKMDCNRIKEETMWEVDVSSVTALHDELDVKIVEAKKILEAVMPSVPKYANKCYPKKPLKKGKKKGDPLVLSASGESWNDTVGSIAKINDTGDAIVKMDIGFPEKVDLSTWKEGVGEGVRLKVLNKYEDPNAGSSAQIKELLFSHGWKPQTFDFVDDKDAIVEWEAGGCKRRKPKPRMVPQISKVGVDGGKELCPSVIALAEKVPEIMAYQKYTTIANRRSTVKGWLENLIGGKFLQARCQGLTNTLRERHTNLVNIPGVKKPYGKQMRGALIAGKGKISLGSDLSSLEDRVKQQFMIPYDPDYVATMMSEGYDPHILMCKEAGLISEEEYKDSLEGEHSSNVTEQRPHGKTVNYAAIYKVGAEGLSRSSGLTVPFCKELLETYWRLNWSVEAIAEEQVVFTCGRGGKWLVNPINGFCYSLRTEKDKFSTLAQGTGSFFFDMWIDNVLEGMHDKFGVKRLNGLFHDEFISSFKDTKDNRKGMEQITFDAIDKVNDTYMLRRKLGCDVQFGTNYAQIH